MKACADDCKEGRSDTTLAPHVICLGSVCKLKLCLSACALPQAQVSGATLAPHALQVRVSVLSCLKAKSGILRRSTTQNDMQKDFAYML